MSLAFQTMEGQGLNDLIDNEDRYSDSNYSESESVWNEPASLSDITNYADSYSSET